MWLSLFSLPENLILKMAYRSEKPSLSNSYSVSDSSDSANLKFALCFSLLKLSESLSSSSEQLLCTLSESDCDPCDCNSSTSDSLGLKAVFEFSTNSLGMP